MQHFELNLQIYTYLFYLATCACFYCFSEVAFDHLSLSNLADDEQAATPVYNIWNIPYDLRATSLDHSTWARRGWQLVTAEQLPIERKIGMIIRSPQHTREVSQLATCQHPQLWLDNTSTIFHQFLICERNSVIYNVADYVTAKSRQDLTNVGKLPAGRTSWFELWQGFSYFAD